MGIYNGRHVRMTAAPRYRHRLLMAAAWLFVSIWPVSSASVAYAQDHDIQDLVLEARMGQAVITPAAVVLESEGRYYLPLLDLSENFEFAITDSDISRGYVEGWYISEDNTFSVDRQKKEAYHKGKRIELSDINFVDDPYGEGNELFLQMEVFNQIWPEISFTVDLAGLQLLAASDATFPFMERKERQTRQKFLEARRAVTSGPQKELPYFKNPYGLISKPVIDIDNSVSWAAADRELTAQTSINGAQDFLWLTADYGLTIAREADGYSPPEALRLTFSRETMPDAPLPLGVERFEFGDTRVNYREAIANGTAGRGFYFTTSKNDPNREFDVITVEGNGPPGWETELYRNNELIDFGIVDSKGEYRFEDVSTQYGNNRIRVILYGPQGQIREEVKDYNFGSSMLRPGQHSVSGGFVDADRDFVPLYEDESVSARPEGIAQSLAGAYGLTRDVTLYSSYNALPTTDGDKDYVTGGATFSAAGGFGQVEVYKGVNNGEALDLRFLTELLGIRLNLATTFFNRFESPTSGFGDNAKKQENEILATRNFRLPFGSLGLQFDINRVTRYDDSTDLSLGTRQTISYSGTQFSHQTDTRVRDGHHESSSGVLTANARMRNWRVRGNLSYTTFPESLLTNSSAELRYQTADDFTFAVSTQYDFVQDVIGAGFQVGYDFKRFLGSFDANWLDGSGWQMMLRASTSLGPYGEDGGYNMVSEAQRSLAPIRGHAFLDHNANDLFDEGDAPLKGARLNVSGRISEDESNDEGYVIARQSDQVGLVNVALETSSLEDPYYAPAIEGYSMALRPGSMPDIKFPVIETGAIDGTISSVDSGDPVQGINIQLVNEKGEVVAVTEAAYDGFYTFEFVRPGTYIVRVDPAYQVNVPPITVTVVSDDLFASGVDLQLQEQEKGTDGETTAADTGAADQASFDQEFEEALSQEAGTDDAVMGPPNGAERGRVAQPTHETPNGTTPTPAPHSSDGSLSAVVHRVRIGGLPDKPRFVMELSGSVNYKASVSADGLEVIIDLPDVAWDALVQSKKTGNAFIPSYQADALVDESGKITGTRLRLSASQPAVLAGQGLLPPEGKSGYRLFIDIGKK